MRPYKTKDPRDDDMDGILKPCFKIGPDVELREIPSTGEEYLLKVMVERQNVAVITTCTQDVSEFAKNQNRFIEEIPRATVCDKLKPTLEWQTIQVADFSEVRKKLCWLRANKHNYNDRIYKLEREPTRLWEWKQLFQSTEPKMSVVLGFRNALVDMGLENMICILDEVNPGESIHDRRGLWTYALLACVVQPLLSETTSILRDLARKCAEIRSHIDPDAQNAMEAVAPLNTFICLVGRYFQQFDLAD